jgi:hypothetical protein
MEEQIITQEERKKFELSVKNYSTREVDLYYKTKKIREYHATDNNWKAVKIALDYGATLVGANKPNQEEYMILKKFLAEQFKDFSGAEIMLAFDKAAVGQIKKPAEHHYGKFSGQYVAGVLTEYKSFRHQKIAQHQREEREREPQKEADTEQRKQIRYDYIDQCFLKPYIALKELGRNTFETINAVFFFKLLYSQGTLRPSKEQLADYKEKAELKVKLEVLADNQDFRQARKIKADIENYEKGVPSAIDEKVKEKAAYLCFIDYVKQLIKENTDIKDFLQTNKFYEV